MQLDILSFMFLTSYTLLTKLFLLCPEEIKTRFGLDSSEINFTLGISYLSLAIGQLSGILSSSRAIRRKIQVVFILQICCVCILLKSTQSDIFTVFLISRILQGFCAGFLKSMICGLMGNRGFLGLKRYAIIHMVCSLLGVLILNIVRLCSRSYFFYIIGSILVFANSTAVLVAENLEERIESNLSLKDFLHIFFHKNNIIYSAIFSLSYSSLQVLFINFENVVGTSKYILVYKSAILIFVILLSLWKKIYDKIFMLIYYFISFFSLLSSKTYILAIISSYLNTVTFHTLLGKKLQDELCNKYLTINAFFIARTLLTSVFILLIQRGDVVNNLIFGSFISGVLLIYVLKDEFSS